MPAALDKHPNPIGSAGTLYSRPHQSFQWSDIRIDLHYATQVASLASLHASSASELLIFCASVVKFGFNFLVNESFVVLKILLDVDFEFDHVV